MNQQIDELATSLRKTIEAAAASPVLDDDGYARTLRRALALLWSAHDEIESLQSLSRRHA